MQHQTDIGVTPVKTTNIPLAGLEPHKLALAFPKYKSKDFVILFRDIQEHGVRVPITMFEGKVLDGRNRFEAAARAGLTEIPASEFEGSFDQARDFVISLNMNRRHLTDDQRAGIAAKLATMKHGGNRSKPPIGGLPPDIPPDMSIADAADKMKVSKRTAERAKALEREDPALLDEVIGGETRKKAAAKKTHKPVEPSTAEPVEPDYDAIDNASKLTVAITSNLAGAELLDSLKYFGWLPEFPALVDTSTEFVIDGRKRLAIAEELGIEPVIKIVETPEGLRLLQKRTAHNIQAPLTKKDKARIASHLGLDHFSVQAIAELFAKVSDATMPVDDEDEERTP
jgi:ParB-like chromosome segregation protein Spo0J